MTYQSTQRDFTMRDVPLAKILVKERHREPRKSDIKKLAASIREIGLRTPITVRISDPTATAAKATYELLAGFSRFQAVQSLGWQTIPVCIQGFSSDEEAELWEIDENLMRGRLTPAERASHLSRRKELFELIRINGESVATIRDRGRPKEFAQDTADKTGESKSGINRVLAQAAAIGAETLQVVAGTSLDKGVELDALAKMSPEQRAPIIAAAASGQRVSAIQAAKSEAEIIIEESNAIVRAWNKARPEARELALEQIDIAVMDRRYG